MSTNEHLDRGDGKVLEYACLLVPGRGYGDGKWHGNGYGNSRIRKEYASNDEYPYMLIKV